MKNWSIPQINKLFWLMNNLLNKPLLINNKIKKKIYKHIVNKNFLNIENYLLNKLRLNKFNYNIVNNLNYDYYVNLIKTYNIIKTNNVIILLFINGIFIKNKNFDIIPFININFNNQIIICSRKQNIFCYLLELLCNNSYKINIYDNQYLPKIIYFLKINIPLKEYKDKSYINYNINKYYLSIKSNKLIKIIDQTINLTNTNNDNFLTTNFINIQANNNTNLQYYKINNHNNNNIIFEQYNFHLKNNCHISLFDLMLAYNKFIKKNYNIFMHGNNNLSKIKGLILAKQNQHSIINNYVAHYGLCNKSYQHYNIVANHTSKTIVAGLIYIKKKAIKSDANLTFNSLMINKFAYVEFNPYLIIKEKNIINCQHQIKIKHLNKLMELTFLNSRGINNYLGIKILIHSYCLEIINCILDKMIKSLILKINE